MVAPKQQLSLLLINKSKTIMLVTGIALLFLWLPVTLTSANSFSEAQVIYLEIVEVKLRGREADMFVRCYSILVLMP